uniref:SET domain containing protein n=1 Tax=Babesia bovis TaxID=5865 RepID=S6B304_BABBO|nr:SET domain containing protein [Babesia bovis]
MFDMCSLYSSTKDAHCIKSKPSPVDILNGIWTSGDLYRYERSQTLLRLRAECDIDEGSKLPASPIAPLLADNAIMNHALLNYCKLLVMGGYCMKEWDLCNTKEFAAGIPWSIVALENNEISLLRALESGCAFPDFYYSAKRFIQRVSMVQSRRYGGIQGCENLQRLMDLTWGATECCYVCSGYGDCKNCDHCGDVLHDDNACGDFHVDQSGMNLCNMCQNSSHRLDWLLASDIVRERLAMRLWQLRMDRDYGHSREILRNIVQRKSVITPAIRHAALVEDTSPERYANALTQFTGNPKHVFCTKREVERYSKSHVGFIDGQSRYHVMCQNAIGNYECFW